MNWDTEFHDDFIPEFEALSETVQDEILAKANLLALEGPTLGRPHVNQLKGSKFKNMKEMRLLADNGVWRIAFAFDPNQKAIVLVAGDKAGKNEDRFYKKLIKIADARFENHLGD